MHLDNLSMSWSSLATGCSLSGMFSYLDDYEWHELCYNMKLPHINSLILKKIVVYFIICFCNANGLYSIRAFSPYIRIFIGFRLSLPGVFNNLDRVVADLVQVDGVWKVSTPLNGMMTLLNTTSSCPL